MAWRRERKEAAPAVFAALAAFGATAAAGAGLVFGLGAGLPGVEVSGVDGAGHAWTLGAGVGLGAYKEWLLEQVFTPASDYTVVRATLERYGMAGGFEGRAWGVSGVAAAAAAAAWVRVRRYADTVIPGVTQARGLRLREGGSGVKHAKRDLARDVKRRGRGIVLAPDMTAFEGKAKRSRADNAAEMARVRAIVEGSLIPDGVVLPRSREVQGIFIMGAPGSGKTVFYRWLLSQIIGRSNRLYREYQDWRTAIEARVMEEVAAGRRRDPATYTAAQKVVYEKKVAKAVLGQMKEWPDKIVCVDAAKGDFTSQWPSDDFIYLAPHDTGMRAGKAIGYQWSIGEDIVGGPAADDFVARMIPETDDPYWSDGARSIGRAIIVGLQATMDTSWLWSDLYEKLSAPPQEINAWVKMFYPMASSCVAVTKDGNFTKTADSFMNAVRNGLGKTVGLLAQAWPRDCPLPKISLRDWVLNDDPSRFPRTLILQRSGDAVEMSRLVIGAAVKVISALTASPELGESDARRIWLSLDEAPQILQKNDGIQEVIEVGRSRGFCVIIGMQTRSQLEIRWSEAEMKSLFDMIRTKMIFQIPPGEGAEYVAEHQVGWADVEMTDRSISSGSGNGPSVSTSIKRENLYVVRPGYLDANLGDAVFGVYGLWIGKKDLCRFLWPFTPWPTRRSPSEQAPWVRDNGCDPEKLAEWTARAARIDDENGDDGPVMLAPTPGMMAGGGGTRLRMGGGQRGAPTWGTEITGGEVVAGRSGATASVAPVTVAGSGSGSREQESSGVDEVMTRLVANGAVSENEVVEILGAVGARRFGTNIDQVAAARGLRVGVDTGGGEMRYVFKEEAPHP